MVAGILNNLRKICCSIVFVVFLSGLFTVSAVAEMQSCVEKVEFQQMDWTELSIHNEFQSRDCHSRFSAALKAKADTNEMLSHAVYHQILAGESFRKIPLWPNKHEDWIGSYDEYYYAAVFRPAIKAADESWEKGFNGGVKHDFAVGWTLAVLEGDFKINDERNRTGRNFAVKAYMGLPGLLLIILVLTESLIDRLGLFPGRRFFYRYKYR